MSKIWIGQSVLIRKTHGRLWNQRIMAHIDFSSWAVTSSGHNTYYSSKGGSSVDSGKFAKEGRCCSKRKKSMVTYFNLRMKLGYVRFMM